MRNLFKLKPSKEGGKVKDKKETLNLPVEEAHEDIQLVTSPSKAEYCENDEELGYC